MQAGIVLDDASPFEIQYLSGSARPPVFTFAVPTIPSEKHRIAETRLSLFNGILLTSLLSTMKFEYLH